MPGYREKGRCITHTDRGDKAVAINCIDIKKDVLTTKDNGALKKGNINKQQQLMAWWQDAGAVFIWQTHRAEEVPQFGGFLVQDYRSYAELTADTADYLDITQRRNDTLIGNSE